MRIPTLPLFFTAILLSTPVFAQSLSPEDIARMLNDQKPVENPYARLLNDPDPTRAIGAMRIMMESGDSALTALALEHGLLSANPDVRLAALDGYLRTRPRLLVTIDGSAEQTSKLMAFANNSDATISEVGKIYFRWQLGAYDAESDCIMDSEKNECAFVINSSGISLTVTRFYQMRGMVTISPDGDLIGNPLLGDDRFPIRIQLLD